MKIFRCDSCRQPVYFENTQCLNCGSALGFDPESLGMMANPAASDRRLCSNHARGVCNWLLTDDALDGLCTACGLNRTIPDLTAPDAPERWRALEIAKHRMVYGLLRFGLPLISKRAQEQPGLCFDFLADGPSPFREGDHVLTGHAQGVITLNIAEADPALREQQRMDMGERYRTLLGHFRHEVGHYYWERLIKVPGRFGACRAVFGDERANYGEALEQHYASPDDGSWRATHVSNYAASHPWEDWAESWAHIMHMIDTLETARTLGLALDLFSAERTRGGAPPNTSEVDFDPYRCTDFSRILDAWYPVSHAMNSLNRSMGKADAYPFVLPKAVTDKLAYVHGVIHATR